MLTLVLFTHLAVVCNHIIIIIFFPSCFCAPDECLFNCHSLYSVFLVNPLQGEISDTWAAKWSTIVTNQSQTVSVCCLVLSTYCIVGFWSFFIENSCLLLPKMLEKTESNKTVKLWIWQLKNGLLKNITVYRSNYFCKTLLVYLLSLWTIHHILFLWILSNCK